MAFEQPVNLLQPSFSRGEVSPFLFGRVDLSGWAQGLRTCRNFTVRPEGCVANRQGFGFVGNSVTSTSKGSSLLPFIFSATQSYVIEVGAGSAQVFSQGALVSSATVTITGGTFTLSTHPPGYQIVFTTSAPHGLTTGQNCTISGVVGSGAFALVNGTQTVANVISTTQFTIWSPLGNSGSYASGGALGGPLTFSTPWVAADLPLLRYSQSSDTLTVAHSKYPTYEIKRTSANSFTCLPAVYINGPFLQQNTDGTTFVYASGKSGTVTLTSTAPIFNANHVGALFQLTQQDLSQIDPWEPTKQFPATSIVGQYRRASLKNYLAVSMVSSSPGTQNATGTSVPSHSQGVQADGDGNVIVSIGTGGVNWLYQDSGFGVVLITGYTSPTQVTGVVQPNYTGGPGLLPIAVVGGPQAVGGTSVQFSGNGSTTSFGPLTAGTTTDPSKLYVTIGGAYQPPALYSITAAGGNIVFLSPPATGTNNIQVEQITALGQTTFWAFGAFSADQGYAGAVSYFPDRLVLAATRKSPVGVFGSKTSIYHDFSVSNPVVASDGFSVFLNARQLNAISDLIPLSDLLVGTSNITWRLWAGSTGTALGPLAIASTPQSYYGQSPNCASLLFGDSAIFPVFDGRRLRDLIYQFAFDKFMGQELTLYSRHLIPYGKQFQRLMYKPDSQGELVFGLRTDGVLLCCSYLREQQIIGWSRWDTQGSFEDICVVPETLLNNTLGFSLYAIVNRTINGVQNRYVERLESREVNTVYDYQFTDCNFTYDGRNTSSTGMTLTGGTTWLAGDVGTLTASSSAGWANFISSDVTSNNEIWLFQTITFTNSVEGDAIGVLTSAVLPGNYVLMFSDGESRVVTIASDGITCTWQNVLQNGVPILSGVVRCRLVITGYASATQVSVRLRDPCPAGLRGIPTTVWTFARTTFSGASAIAGMAAVALADGNVVGINAAQRAANGSLTIGIDGSVILPSAGGVVNVGLPYLCDIETLPLNQQGQETIRMRAKAEPVIYLDVTETRNFLAGTDFNTVLPNPQRSFEPYTAQTALQSGVLWTRINSELTSECHTCIRQNMPLPITIRAHIPAVEIGEPIS
jgi:hypothetical protein